MRKACAGANSSGSMNKPSAESAGPQASAPASSSDVAPWGRRIHGPTLPGQGVCCARQSPLTQSEIEEISGIIARARRNRCLAPEFPEHLKTRHWDSVMAVIEAVNEQLDWPSAGWKIGAASEEIQRAEKVPGPCPGQIAREGVFPSPARLPGGLFIRYRCAECEFAFRMGIGLNSRKDPYSDEEVADAVESLHSAIEIGDCVFEDWYGLSGYFGGSMDNGGAGAFVPGAPIRDWRHIDLANARIDLYLNGQYRKSGYGRASMGNPLTSLTWMVNWLSKRGKGLEAGAYISTGTCTGHFFTAPGDQLLADFGQIGKVSAFFE